MTDAEVSISIYYARISDNITKGIFSKLTLNIRRNDLQIDNAIRAAEQN